MAFGAAKRWTRNGMLWLLKQNPAEGFCQGVEGFRAAFATESEPNSEVICTFPVEESSEVRVDRKNFESGGDISF